MSLNSVVNNLVRAAAGIPADISDKDLDQHVAELLAKEAKEREMKWSEIGLGGLLGSGDRGSPDPNAPKPNKRFLASVIRTVDNHNSSVIRQQLEAAETARSNSGLGESSRSAASRMFGGAMRDAAKPRHRDRDRGRPYDQRGRRELDKQEKRDREEERWHDKRAASRERRTRYDVDEEEEMCNRGDDSVAERKERRDWIKRKEERDRRKREAKEDEGDEERERRRSRLYGDDTEADRGDRRSRRQEEDEEQEINGKPESSSRRERRDHSREREKDRGSERRRRRRSVDSLEEDGAKSERRSRKEHRRERTDEDERSPSRSPRPSRRQDREKRHSPVHRNGDTPPRESVSTKHGRNKDRNGDLSPEKEESARTRRRASPPPSPPSRKKSSRHDSPTPGPSPPPPPDAAPPPPDSPPPPPPPPVASKMDKYFKADYDPRLDLGEVPRDGYVPEVGWDNMLAILKERGKKPRNRSPGLYDDPLEIPKVHLRRTPSPTLKEIEKAERRAKRAARGFDDDFETEAERAKRKAERKKEKEERARVTQLGPGDGGGLFDVSYVKKGGVREWDVGK